MRGLYRSTDWLQKGVCIQVVDGRDVGLSNVVTCFGIFLAKSVVKIVDWGTFGQANRFDCVEISGCAARRITRDPFSGKSLQDRWRK